LITITTPNISNTSAARTKHFQRQYPYQLKRHPTTSNHPPPQTTIHCFKQTLTTSNKPLLAQTTTQHLKQPLNASNNHPMLQTTTQRSKQPPATLNDSPPPQTNPYHLK
jgi:hypothetical protein